MNRAQAIAIAQACAKANRPSYYSEPFVPHEWVIDAIMSACSGDVITAGVDVAADRIEVDITSWPMTRAPYSTRFIPCTCGAAEKDDCACIKADADAPSATPDKCQCPGAKLGPPHVHQPGCVAGELAC